MADKQNNCYTVKIKESRTYEGYVTAQNQERAREIAIDQYKSEHLHLKQCNSTITEVIISQSEEQTADRVKKIMEAQLALKDTINKHPDRMSLPTISLINDTLYDLVRGKIHGTTISEVKDWFEERGFSATPDGIGWEIRLD